LRGEKKKKNKRVNGLNEGGWVYLREKAYAALARRGKTGIVHCREGGERNGGERKSHSGRGSV